MQEWFTANYFQNDLPLRRSFETAFRTLQVLKEETQSDAQPFLTRPAPKLPPNLPIPALASTQPSPTPINTSIPNEPTRLAPQNDTLRQMLAELQQNQGSTDARTLQTPLRNGVLGATSPGISVSRPIAESFAHSASYASSPVSQHAGPIRSVWDSAPSPAIGRPSIPTSPFAPEVIAGVQHMGGFPQPQFTQQRSIFDAQHAQPQSPYAPSPWGVQMPPQQMPLHMQQPAYPSSPFGQIPQQPFGQFPTQPMAQPWQNAQFAQPQNMGSPAPMSAQSVPQFMAQDAPAAPAEPISSVQQTFSPSPVPAQLGADLIKSPVQPNKTPEQPVAPVEEAQKPAAWAEIAPVAAEPIAPKQQPKPEQIQSTLPSAAPIPSIAPATKTPASEAKKESKPVEAAPEPVVQVESRASTPPVAAPSVAPWAAEDKAKSTKSMSLKEIQDAEARVAEKKRLAEAKAKAALAASQPVAESSEPLQQMSFGLASRPALNTASSASSNTSVPVWGATPVVGSKKQMPKRTLQQIQDEERAKKVRKDRCSVLSYMRLTLGP
jgi:PERQ amino acid-rich with GYF domain-containing protein